MTYTLQSAQANLDRLLTEAGEGHEIVIAREGRPAIRLAIVEVSQTATPAATRVFGLDRGLVEYEDSALDPLSEEELAEYGFGFMLDTKTGSDETQAPKAG